MVLEKALESPLDCKEIQPVHPKDQSWVFIGRTDVEAEAPILWPPDAKSQFIGKDPDAAAATKSLQSCPTLCDPIDGSPPGSLSLGFSRQEHWSGLPFPSPMQESEK